MCGRVCVCVPCAVELRRCLHFMAARQLWLCHPPCRAVAGQAARGGGPYRDLLVRRDWQCPIHPKDIKVLDQRPETRKK